MDSTTTTTRSPTAPAAGTSAAPAFSYAQAAKGRAISTAASASQSSQTASGVSTPVKESKSFSNTPSGSVNGAPSSDAGERSVIASLEAVPAPELVSAEPTVEANSELKPTSRQNSRSVPNSPSSATASIHTLPKEEELTLPAAAPSNSHTPSKTEKSAEHSEVRRGRKGKKAKNAEKEVDKEAEKEKEEVKQEILVPAQAPTVNIWKQRIEEQAAKAKTNPVPQSPPLTSDSSILYDVVDGTKGGEQRKRGKATTVDDGEALLAASQNGGPRESLNGKGQRKGSESNNRTKEDSSAKRSGARNGRGSEKDEKPVAHQLPPPVEDATSWPTPETALEEEKRKAQEKEKVEREDKDENTSNKPRQKEKWVSVPYIPTVTFNTPMPVRGGRGRGGARGARQDAGGRSSHTNGGQNGDKAQNNSPPNTTTQGEPEKRTFTRANSLPPSNSKRQQSDQANPRDRKFSVVPNGENSKAAQKNETSVSSDDARVAISSKPEPSSEGRRDQQSNQGENSKGYKVENGQTSFNEHPTSSRPADRRSEPNLRDSELFREGNMFNKENYQVRERIEGRPDRGRGGYRGRGGHGNYAASQQTSQHMFANSYGPVQAAGFSGNRTVGPYSPPIQQGPFSNQFNTLPMRGARGGSRSQSIPNNNLFGRYPSNGNAPQMVPVQTANAIFDYPLQAMNAAPYNPFVDQYSVLAMVTMQLEYYFSIDNLCKDVFLRKHMDSQGFVFLTFIAGFKRIQALTQDFDLLRYACQESEIVEIIRGDDGIDRLRRREGWDQWVLAKEERDASVRSDGPPSHFRQPFAPRSQNMAPMVLQSQPAMALPVAPPAFTQESTEPSSRPYGNGVAPVANGNGNGNAHHQPETPLSAAVPDFSPSFRPLTSSPTRLELETTFTDEEVPWLILVFYPQKAADEDHKPTMPVRNISSRTFSNGSIDGRSLVEALHESSRQGQPLTNLTNGSSIPDITSPESLKRSLSPFAPLSPSKPFIENSPPVMWVKGQRGQAPISENNTQELYTSFRTRAFKHREASTSGVTHHDMRQLYEFWAHFLCRNFNPTMYAEFRKSAYEDAEQQSMAGITNLILYYDEILNSKKQVIPETLARHYVELVKFEQTITEPKDNRPAFNKLRATLRNGALDLKSRKKIDSFVDVKLRADLER